jgi:hypothetical protein
VEVSTDETKKLLVFTFRYPSTTTRVSSLRYANQGDLTYKLRASMRKGG